MLASTLLSLAGLVSLSAAGYVLEDDYEPSSFFGMFDFFTGADPTNGYVQYMDQTSAQAQGLINTNGPVYIGVDHTNVASGSGRGSVRITSKKSYNHGLIILDATHMPGGVCGTWPAFWTVGPNWPNSGEIDIIEGVNSQSTDSMTLHTSTGCTITNNGEFSGTLGTTNCYVNAAGQATNAGCQINSPNTASFGTEFNAGSGGVYATEWTSEAISIWFFTRSAIPADIGSGTPDPTSWGSPTASFSGGCDIDEFFMNQQIVFDTTFCGDWAGNVWSTDSVCSSMASTCQSFVQNNPSTFVDAYWSVNSLKVYQSNGSPSPAAQSGSAVSSIAATAASSIPGGLTTSTNISISTSFTTSVSTSTPFATSSEQFTVASQSYTRRGSQSFTGNVAVQSTTAAVSESVGTDTTAAASTPSISDVPDSAATVTNSSTTQSTQAAIAAMTTTPPNTQATTSLHSHLEYITVSALQTYQFPSEGERQTTGVNGKAKRDLHRHLVGHQKRHGLVF